MKDVLKCIIGAPGELYVTIRSPTQQQELFATCSDTDALDGLLVTATVPVVERFGWTKFSALEGKRTLYTVHTAPGAVTTVDTVKMFQYHA